MQDGRPMDKRDGAHQPGTGTHLRLRHARRAVPKGGLDIKLLGMRLQVVSLVGQRLSLSLGVSLHTAHLQIKSLSKLKVTALPDAAQSLVLRHRNFASPGSSPAIVAAARLITPPHRVPSSSAHLSVSMGLRLGCQVVSLRGSLQLCLGVSVGLLLQRHGLLSVMGLAHPCTATLLDFTHAAEHASAGPSHLLVISLAGSCTA